MLIASHLPDLTVDEADRYWLMPAALCQLSALGDPDATAKLPSPYDVRRFLDHITAEGHIPSEKSGTSRTSPRLYSCIAAIMMRTMWEVSVSGRTYRFAGAIASHVADLARELIAETYMLDQIDTTEPDWLVLYAANPEGKVDSIRTVRAFDFTPQILRKGGFYDHGVLEAGEIIWNMLRGYGEAWADDLRARGLLEIAPTPIGPDGWPIR
jgi:hypothetical protein